MIICTFKDIVSERIFAAQSIGERNIDDAKVLT